MIQRKRWLHGLRDDFGYWFSCGVRDWLGGSFDFGGKAVIGDKVLVHTIGPNGVYAKVLSTFYNRVKVKYYDAADGGDIVRWVSVLEIACNQNRDDRSEGGKS